MKERALEPFKFGHAVRRVLLASFACLVMHAASFAKAEDASLPASITAGSELDYPPYAIVKPDGEPDGFSVELLKAVASEMRINVSFQVGPWNNVLDKFRAGQLDVLPLFATNPERAQYADATVPYLTVYGAVFVRNDERRIHAFRDLPGKSVIVMKGDFGHEYALSHGLGDHLITTRSLAEGMKLLASGEHDALLVSRLGGLQVLKQLGINNVVPVGPPIDDYHLKFSFAVRKGNAKLLATLNEGLALVKTKGAYDDIRDKWLGVLDPRPVSFKDFLPYLIPAAGILIALLAGLIVQRRFLILRKRTEEQLREQREWLHVTLKSIGDGVIATDLEGKVTFMNLVAEDLTGWLLSEAVGKRVDHVFHIVNEHSRQVVENPVNKVLETGASAGLANHTVLVRRDGTEIPIDDSGAPIKDGNGKATGVVLVFRDITDRKRAEEYLLRSREGLSRLADASLRLVREADLEGMMQALSEAALTLTRARIASCIFGYVNGQFPVSAAARAPGVPACPAGKMFTIEKGGVYMELVDGGSDSIRLTDEQMRAHPRWWGLPEGHVPMRGLLGVRLVDRHGRANGMILVTDKERGDFSAEDESLLRQLGTLASLASQHVEARVALEEADRSKNEFLAMLSHELRNPLAPIHNSVAILDRAVPGSEQARRAQAVIARQVAQMTRLVDELLDVTRISRGKIQLQRESLDFSDVVRRVVEDHRAVFATNDLDLQVSIPDEQIRINGDRTRVAQVIGNLLGNAAKFTPPGGKVTVIVQVNDGLGQAMARVRDTGPGIAPQMLTRIFEPFTQGDATLDRSKGGLGLGLALVKSIMHMHGGTASAASEGQGMGAEFVIHFPLETPFAAATEAVRAAG